MTKFRPLTESMLASPQIDLSDIADAKEQGVTMIVNNRPDGEDPTAPQSDAVEQAASEAGIEYVAIPIGHSGFSDPQVDQMIATIDKADGKILAYCRSGTRSTFLWALAQAKTGADPEEIAHAAGEAGYDVSPIRPMMDMLAAR